MNELQALERELAELLGWTNIETLTTSSGDVHGLSGFRPGYSWDAKPVPRWTADDAAAFQLVVEHELEVMWAGNSVASYGEGCDIAEENIAAHPSKAGAVRAAIVRAVIAKLEGKQ